MSALRPRLEPHLAGVENSARYIGLEPGAQTPAHRPGTVSWLLACPDTYEIGLPNQGLQINERSDAVAERSHVPGSDFESIMRGEGVPLFPPSLTATNALATLDPECDAVRVTRINQWTQDGGARREVIDLPSAATPLPPHAEARAS